MWKKTTSELEQCLLTSAIGMIFNHDEHWLTFFFSHKQIELRLPPLELLKEARCFSHGEQILIKAALDIWTGEGYATIAELIDVLDYENLIRVILAIQMVRDISICDLDDLLLRRYEVED